MPEQVNIFKIAREAGVSIATVSRVISGAGNVRPSTRDKVIEVVRRYNFKPNKIATGLSQKKSGMLGLVLPSLANPFYTKLCISAQREAQLNGYSTLFFQVDKGEVFDQDFIDILIGKRLEGVLLSCDMVGESSRGSVANMIKQLRGHMPIVLLDPLDDSQPCPGFRCDLYGAAKRGAEYLHALGHRRIALLGGAGRVPHPLTRERGYLDAMRDLGLEPYPFIYGETHQEGEVAVSRAFSWPAPRPTALIAFNDIMALGILKGLKSLGLRVPEDVSVLSFDNLFFSAYTDPPLTTFDFGVAEIARMGMQQLVSLTADNMGEGFCKVTEATLNVRSSCGPCA